MLSYAGTSLVCGAGTSGCCRPQYLTGRVRYYGDDIAAVVAEDEITAQRALRLIEVEYEEYPVEIHPRKSMYGSKPPIHLDKKGQCTCPVPITLSEMWKKG